MDQSLGDDSLIQLRILPSFDQLRDGLISRFEGLPFFRMILFRARKEYGRPVLKGRTLTCVPDSWSYQASRQWTCTCHATNSGVRSRSTCLVSPERNLSCLTLNSQAGGGRIKSNTKPARQLGAKINFC
jgi:hypothetical protein